MLPFDSTSFIEVIGNFIFIYWCIYSFWYIYAYIFIAENCFNQTYIYWVLQPKPKLSKFGHGLFIIWCIPSMIVEIIMQLLYSLLTGKKLDIYSKDK